ncbi:MAG: hypothetical protein IJ159_04440 [Prevotella sp.]|nr:hypothetical protein [Prevotella sp.]
MDRSDIYSAAGLMAFIQEVGFLPLLNSGVYGFSAEEVVSDDCRYVVFPDGGWDWPLWKWKGPIVTEGDCVYGKFFDKKAGFISRKWWPDFYNYRRSKYPIPSEGSIEETILLTLQEQGSLITRELRALCGFDGPKMRSRFDSYVTRLQMGCYIVTEDFVYPTDKHGKEYGWGWSLLTTPETLFGHSACTTDISPEESYHRLMQHFRKILPDATERQIQKLIG